MTNSDSLRTTRAVLAAVGCLLALMIGQHFMPPDPARAFPTSAIRIGIDASFPPFALDDGETLSGLEIDLAGALAQQIGLSAEFHNLNYYSLYDALISDEVDVLLSSLPVDPARMDDARYTQPYFDNGLQLVAPAGAPRLDTDKLAGERIAVEYASSADSLLRRWSAENKLLERLPYELPNHALDALRLGHADAALVDHLTYRLYQRHHRDWQSASQFVTHEPFAIAIRRENRDARRLIEAALASLQASGELARIVDEWL